MDKENQPKKPPFVLFTTARHKGNSPFKKNFGMPETFVRKPRALHLSSQNPIRAVPAPKNTKVKKRTPAARLVTEEQPGPSGEPAESPIQLSCEDLVVPGSGIVDPIQPEVVSSSTTIGQEENDVHAEIETNHPPSIECEQPAIETPSIARTSLEAINDLIPELSTSTNNHLEENAPTVEELSRCGSIPIEVAEIEIHETSVDFQDILSQIKTSFTASPSIAMTPSPQRLIPETDEVLSSEVTDQVETAQNEKINPDTVQTEVENQNLPESNEGQDVQSAIDGLMILSTSVAEPLTEPTEVVISEDISHEEAVDAFYREKLDSETTRLSEMADVWEAVPKDATIPSSSILDEIDATVGQTRLLIRSKFKQFSNLVDTYSSHKLQPQDLQGFWEMMYLQVEQLDNKFAKLHTLKENQWQPLEEKKEVRKKTKRGGRKRGKKFANVPSRFKNAAPTPTQTEEVPKIDECPETLKAFPPKINEIIENARRTRRSSIGIIIRQSLTGKLPHLNC